MQCASPKTIKHLVSVHQELFQIPFLMLNVFLLIDVVLIHVTVQVFAKLPKQDTYVNVLLAH